MDARHRHNITWAEADSDTDEFAHAAYAGAGVRNDFLSLKEPSLVTFRPERDDKLNLVVTSVFPSAVFVQISNSLAVRQIRPRGVDEVEVFQINGLYRSSRQIWDGSAGKCMWIMKRCNFRL